jgi:hypothetical protein
MTSWSRRRECGSSKSEKPVWGRVPRPRRRSLWIAIPDSPGPHGCEESGRTTLMTAAENRRTPAAFQAPCEAIAVVFDLVQPAGPVGGTRAAVGMHGSMKPAGKIREHDTDMLRHGTEFDWGSGFPIAARLPVASDQWTISRGGFAFHLFRCRATPSPRLLIRRPEASGASCSGERHRHVPSRARKCGNLHIRRRGWR